MPTETAARMAKKSARKTTSKSKSKRKKSKKLPTCSKRDLRQQAAYKKNKRLPRSKRKKLKRPRKCAVVKKATAVRASPTGPVAAPPYTSSATTAFPTGPSPNPPVVAVPPASTATPTAGNTAQAPDPTDSNDTATLAPPGATGSAGGIPVYSGPFGAEQAYRLLFRAGFGPKPGQAEALSALGLRGAVGALMHPSSTALVGPEPTGSYLVGGAFAPRDKWGHIHLSWLDRMVRGSDPLTERMTLVLHDWFAVSDTAAERPLVVDHLDLLRRNWRGSFRDLLIEVTRDPAMLRFLDGVTSTKAAPNENYARELMELYALGADRGAYTETDIREAARALTGFRCDWGGPEGATNFRYDAARHDAGSKTLFAGKPWQRQGDLTWTDVVNAIVDHPLHSSFVVRKLWSYFIPTEPSADTQSKLESLYRTSGEQLAPLIEAILLHPDLHVGPSMVKPPVVHIAGLLRARRQGIASDVWIWYSRTAGQLLGEPPHVSGWNDLAWLNTSTYEARWAAARYVIGTDVATSASFVGAPETSAQALSNALEFWGNPSLSPGHRGLLEKIANWTYTKGAPGTYGKAEDFLSNRQNILRQVAASASDFQVC